MSICLEYFTLYSLKQDAQIHESKRDYQALRGQQSAEKEKQDVKVFNNDLEDHSIFEIRFAK